MNNWLEKKEILQKLIDQNEGFRYGELNTIKNGEIQFDLGDPRGKFLDLNAMSISELVSEIREIQDELNTIKNYEIEQFSEENNLDEKQVETLIKELSDIEWKYDNYLTLKNTMAMSSNFESIYEVLINDNIHICYI